MYTVGLQNLKYIAQKSKTVCKGLFYTLLSGVPLCIECRFPHILCLDWSSGRSGRNDGHLCLNASHPQVSDTGFTELAKQYFSCLVITCCVVNSKRSYLQLPKQEQEDTANLGVTGEVSSHIL